MNNKRLTILTALLAATTAAHAASTPAPAPAKVANPVKEGELTTVTLTPKAEERLGIVVVAVQKKAVARTRLLGGEVVLPLGPATAQASEAGAFYAPNPPASTAEMLTLSERQTQADGEVAKARVEWDTARVALERAEKLVRSETGSQRALDDARAALRLAEATLANAQLRRQLLGEAVSKTASLDRLWVRVPVYVGDLASLDTAREARIGNLGDRPGAPTRAARFAAGPPSANPGAASVDWFYECDNAGHALRLGQKVGVILPLRGEEESLVVPWAAVLHDVHGGQWVYENSGAQTFVRRRVQVARVEGDLAVLAGGVKPGAKVVTDGAAELFGTEFGAGH